MSPSPWDNPLVSTLESKLQGISTMSSASKQGSPLMRRGSWEEEVYPAWRDGVELLRSLLPQTTDEAGLWRLEGGDEAYAYALKRYTTTDLTADEIHEIGLREVDRIETEMDALFRQIGLTEGSIIERADRLGERLAYPISADGRRQIMADIDEILSDAQERSAACSGNSRPLP